MRIDQATIRKTVDKLATRIYTGRYKPLKATDTETIAVETVPMKGDIPRGVENLYSQYRREYKVARSPEEVREIIYTDRGMAWQDGILYEKYSVRSPSLRDLAKRPKKPKTIISQGTIVHGSFPYTYGDWVPGYLTAIATALPLTAPLLIPDTFARKPYVRRDLDLMGVETHIVANTVLVREALVLPRNRPPHYFAREDVRAIQRALKISSVTPRPESVIYLSREGERAEYTQREYPSRAIAAILSESGVKVVRTCETSQYQYRELATEAETVIADHGGAMCNMLMWKPKHVIELFNDCWWNNCFLMLANALDIKDYTLIRVNDRAPGELARRILQYASIKPKD